MCVCVGGGGGGVVSYNCMLPCVGDLLVFVFDQGSQQNMDQ